MHVKEMVRVSNANLREVETQRRMKRGRHKSFKGKRANDAVTPPGSNVSPALPDQGRNVDNSVRDGLPYQMAGDVVMLASTSTHISNMTFSPKK